MALDDAETFGNFYTSISPSALRDVVVTEEDLSRVQANAPKWVRPPPPPPPPSRWAGNPRP